MVYDCRLSIACVVDDEHRPWRCLVPLDFHFDTASKHLALAVNGEDLKEVNRE